MKTINALVLVTALLLISGQAEAKKVQLRYNLEVGMKFSYESQIITESSQDVMGQSQTVSSDITTGIIVEVMEKKDNGSYSMRYQIVNMKMDTSSPYGSVEFNSEDADEDTIGIGKLMKIYLDTPLEFVMSPFGEVLEILNAEAYSSVMEEMAGGDQMQMMSMGSLMAQFASDDGIKQTLGGVIINFPNKKVKTGSSWETNSEINIQMAMQAEQTTTLAKLGKEAFTLKEVSKITMADGAEGMVMEGMTMEYDVTGGKEGTREMLLATGMLESSETITMMSGVISIDSPQLQTPMAIPMTIKVTEKVKAI